MIFNQLIGCLVYYQKSDREVINAGDQRFYKASFFHFCSPENKKFFIDRRVVLSQSRLRIRKNSKFTY
ncbi:MAG: hypothetical protein CMK28_06715 [Porticoccaceae bacterium]|nr:hypothetical protein [Porticoccaceae bacterium]